MAKMNISLTSRIDELETTILDKVMLENYLRELVADEPQDFNIDNFGALCRGYYTPLGLSGVYRVTGIEGPFCDGYTPGQPWPLALTPELDMATVCLMVVAAPANGYPDINHVWFENVEIDTVSRTIKFSMSC